MNEPVWISLPVVLAVHQQLLARHGGAAGIRDGGLLESALAKPQQLFHYKPEVSVCDLAAAYAMGVMRNHPFVDGNKRTAFVLAALFLGRNGTTLRAEEAEAAAVFMAAAAGSLPEEALAVWLRDLSHRLREFANGHI